MDTPRPACPYCGERQGYDEARPSRPHVVVRKAWERPHKPGQVQTVRETEYFTECRACGRRINWGMDLGEVNIRTGKLRHDRP